MKKAICFTLILISLFLAGCSNEKTGSLTLTASETGWELYSYSDNDNVASDYTYLIFNTNNEKIDSGYFESAEPEFKSFDNGILSVSISAGTFADQTTYYDLETSAVSDTYENVFYDNGEITIFINYDNSNADLYAKQIFGSEYLLSETLDTDGIMTTDFNVSVDGEKITVEHPKGENYENVVETFYLS